MRAVRFTAWQAEPVAADVPTPEPRAGEVLLKIDAAGLCHSDLHLMDAPEGVLPYTLPFTLGHENAGTVAALGPGARGVSEGQRVLVHSRWGCGTCWQCVQGRENLCQIPPVELGSHGGGAGRDGGLAEYMVVPSSRYLVDIEGLDPVEAAPLSDAALTPYHAIQRSLHQLRPNGTAVVIGVGGIGHLAVQILRALSEVRVIAVDRREAALGLAREAGAHAALPADDLTPESLREEVGASGATLVLDCVASDATLRLAAGAVALGGDIAYVGRGGGTLPVRPGNVPFECSVYVPTWGTLAELAEVVALARAGAIHTEVQRLTLDEAVAGYGRLRRGEIVGRAVVVP
jgi:alcohol dehydrogenase, propanol-preferring